MFSPEFFRESLTNFRSWLDECRFPPVSIRGFCSRFPKVLVDAWEQCQGADVLLESPSAMAGVHIAEALSMYVRFYVSTNSDDRCIYRYTL